MSNPKQIHKNFLQGNFVLFFKHHYMAKIITTFLKNKQHAFGSQVPGGMTGIFFKIYL